MSAHRRIQTTGQQKKQSVRIAFLLRREGDSNPRTGFAGYTLSRRASSATRAPLLDKATAKLLFLFITTAIPTIYLGFFNAPTFLLHQHGQRIEIDHRGRDCHERGIEAVEHSSVTRQNITAVLDAERTLEEALHKVSPSAEEHYNQS